MTACSPHITISVNEKGFWRRIDFRKPGEVRPPESKCVVVRELKFGNGFLVLRVGGYAAWTPKLTYVPPVYTLVHVRSVARVIDGTRIMVVEPIADETPGSEWRAVLKQFEVIARRLAG